MAPQTTDQNLQKVFAAGNIIRRTFNQLLDDLEAVLAGRRRETHTLADAGKAALNDGSRTESRVATIINVDDGEAAQVLLDSEDEEAEIIGQTNSTFGTTEDNDTTTNVYYDSGNTQFEINNEKGGERTYVVNYEGEST